MKRLSALVAVLAALGVLRGVIADGPHPGDPATPGDNLPETSVSVRSSNDGVTIYIGITESSSGSSGDPSSSGGTGPDYSGWSCTASIMTGGLDVLAWLMAEAPLHPGAVPWTVQCSDGFFGVVWVPTDADPANVKVVVGPADPIDPGTIAAELRDHLPVPHVTISANPNVGLVALPSWFWVDGYDRSPIRASDTLGGVTVEVEIAPQHYSWSFGDGTTLKTTSPGRPYPAESDVRHAYEQSSLGAGGAFAVTVEISFSARYRVNGGAWQSLDAITRSLTRDYPVQQLQSVLTNN